MYILIYTSLRYRSTPLTDMIWKYTDWRHWKKVPLWENVTQKFYQKKATNYDEVNYHQCTCTNCYLSYSVLLPLETREV
jgi:hypothetical protein